MPKFNFDDDFTKFKEFFPGNVCLHLAPGATLPTEDETLGEAKNLQTALSALGASACPFGWKRLALTHKRDVFLPEFIINRLLPGLVSSETPVFSDADLNFADPELDFADVAVATWFMFVFLETDKKLEPLREKNLMWGMFLAVHCMAKSAYKDKLVDRLRRLLIWQAKSPCKDKHRASLVLRVFEHENAARNGRGRVPLFSILPPLKDMQMLYKLLRAQKKDKAIEENEELSEPVMSAIEGELRRMYVFQGLWHVYHNAFENASPVENWEAQIKDAIAEAWQYDHLLTTSWLLTASDVVPNIARVVQEALPLDNLYMAVVTHLSSGAKCLFLDPLAQLLADAWADDPFRLLIWLRWVCDTPKVFQTFEGFEPMIRSAIERTPVYLPSQWEKILIHLNE